MQTSRKYRLCFVSQHEQPCAPSAIQHMHSHTACTLSTSSCSLHKYPVLYSEDPMPFFAHESKRDAGNMRFSTTVVPTVRTLCDTTHLSVHTTHRTRPFLVYWQASVLMHLTSNTRFCPIMLTLLGHPSSTNMMQKRTRRTICYTHQTYIHTPYAVNAPCCSH